MQDFPLWLNDNPLPEHPQRSQMLHYFQALHHLDFAMTHGDYEEDSQFGVIGNVAQQKMLVNNKLWTETTIQLPLLQISIPHRGLEVYALCDILKWSFTVVSQYPIRKFKTDVIELEEFGKPDQVSFLGFTSYGVPFFENGYREGVKEFSFFCNGSPIYLQRILDRLMEAEI